MSEAPASVIYDEPEIAKADIVNKPEIIGTVETNKGREIKADDLLFYTDRRGPEAFTKLLIEGRVSAPALAQKRGEKFINRRGEASPLMSTINEPNSIYTSLLGPYWSDSCSLVFNAWDTLKNFRFYDQGNTGLKLYNKDGDDNPAEFRFKDSENKAETEFLILEPEHEQGNKMRQMFIESTKGLMTQEEAAAWLDSHIVSIREIKRAAWNTAEILFDGNPEYSKAMKDNLQFMLKETESEKDFWHTELRHHLTWLLKNDDNGHLAEWFAFRIHGLNQFAQDHNSGSTDHFFKSGDSSDLYDPEWHNRDVTISGPLTKLTQEFVEKMQDWLKQEFQKHYGEKSRRKAMVESEGPDNNKRLTLTIEKEVAPHS